MNENKLGSKSLLAVTVGSFGLLAVLIFSVVILASVVSNNNASQISANDAKAKQQIADRIKPVGELNLPSKQESEKSIASVTKEVVAAVVPAANAADDAGKATYDKACFVCHATGVAGAPKFGDAAAWGDRVNKDIAEMQKNAITGFQGKKGVMPPKGGNTALSDDDVKAAVVYMINAVKK